MSKNYINEALSTDGKIAFNYNNVSFKTNSVNALLQQLAWKHNDTYVGTLKKVNFDSSTDFLARAVTELSSNGTPLIFNSLTEETISFNIGLNSDVYMLHMTYMFVDKPELMKLVAPNHVEFIIMLVNGIWFFLNRSENQNFFDKFDEITSAVYVSTDLPKVKLPVAVSMIDNVGNAKKALKQYAKEHTNDFAISTFTAVDDIEILALPSISKFASFAPNVNEFTNREETVFVAKDTEIPYIVDNQNSRIILLINDFFGLPKWFMISEKRYIDLIAYNQQDFFVDSVKNALIASEFNKAVNMDNIYEAIIKNRAVGLLNNIQAEFDYSGYFYVNSFARTINRFNKLSINTDGFVSKVVSTQPLVLYKDTIVTFSVNLKTGIAIIGIPSQKSTCYVVELSPETLPEIYDELIVGNNKNDVTMSISDVYFTDTAGKS